MQYKFLEFSSKQDIILELGTLAIKGWRLMQPGIVLSVINSIRYYYTATIYKSTNEPD